MGHIPNTLYSSSIMERPKKLECFSTTKPLLMYYITSNDYQCYDCSQTKEDKMTTDKMTTEKMTTEKMTTDKMTSDKITIDKMTTD
jgi:hypothetical protein